MMVLDLGETCVERADETMEATSTDIQDKDSDSEKLKPSPAQARTSSVVQQSMLQHNGPLGTQTKNKPKEAIGGSPGRTKQLERLRRPLSLEIKPQRHKADQQCERKVVQPPWRYGAPSPPIRSLTSPSMGPKGFMRRSESTSTVNSMTALRAARGRMRPATSLPHINRGISVATLPTPSTPRGPCLLVALRPVNLELEQHTFFQSDYKYEPQFEYASPEPISVLERYNEGSGLFLSQVC